MLHNGHWTHPELWQLWAVIILTPLNTLGIIYALWRIRNDKANRFEDTNDK
jgi:hypothetical protein